MLNKGNNGWTASKSVPVHAGSWSQWPPAKKDLKKMCAELPFMSSLWAIGSRNWTEQNLHRKEHPLAAAFKVSSAVQLWAYLKRLDQSHYHKWIVYQRSTGINAGIPVLNRNKFYCRHADFEQDYMQVLNSANSDFMSSIFAWVFLYENIYTQVFLLRL